MVVVAVRDQHDVDRRQVGEGDARIVDALRAEEAEGRGAPRPDRVEQHIEPRRLNEQAGMADIGYAPA